MNLTPGSAAGPAKATNEDRHKQTIIALAAVLTLGLTYLLYRHNAAAKAAAGTAVTGNGASTTTTDPTSTDAMQQLGTAQLGMLNTISGQLGSVASLLPTTPTTSATGAAAGTSGTSHTVTGPAKAIPMPIIRGGFGAHTSLRDVAQGLLPVSQQSNPNAVESELRRLVAVNPSLRGKTYLLGGHKNGLVIPAAK